MAEVPACEDASFGKDINVIDISPDINQPQKSKRKAGRTSVVGTGSPRTNTRRGGPSRKIGKSMSENQPTESPPYPLMRRVGSKAPTKQVVFDGMPELGNGDNCKLLSSRDGKFQQCGAGVIIGGPGSKHKGKVIPKKWHLVKVLSVSIGEVACPEQPGNTKPATHLKMQDAINTLVLWPDAQIL